MTKEGQCQLYPSFTNSYDILVQHLWILTKKRILTWQLGDRKSHSLIVLSNEPEINVSSTGDMERDVTLLTHKNKKENMRTEELPTQHKVQTDEHQQSSPFVMSREVADVFVVMKRQVPDSILNNNNTITKLPCHTSNMTSSNSKKQADIQTGSWWVDSTVGKAVTCTVSSCMGQNHRPSNCTNNYLRPKWVVCPRRSSRGPVRYLVYINHWPMSQQYNQ